MLPATQVLLLQMGQHWEQHWGPRGAPSFPGFFGFFGFFHLGFFWLAALGLMLILRRSGERRPGGRDATARTTIPGPQPAHHAGEEGPSWPALYPDEPDRPAQGAQDLSPRGPVEYF